MTKSVLTLNVCRSILPWNLSSIFCHEVLRKIVPHVQSSLLTSVGVGSSQTPQNAWTNINFCRCFHNLACHLVIGGREVVVKNAGGLNYLVYLLWRCVDLAVENSPSVGQDTKRILHDSPRPAEPVVEYLGGVAGDRQVRVWSHHVRFQGKSLIPDQVVWDGHGAI